MAAPFQIIPATPAETAEILALEQLCYPVPWKERIVVAASLPKKGYVARIIMEGQSFLGLCSRFQAGRPSASRAAGRPAREPPKGNWVWPVGFAHLRGS